jgi:hypothetical protein
MNMLASLIFLDPGKLNLHSELIHILYVFQYFRIEMMV